MSENSSTFCLYLLMFPVQTPLRVPLILSHSWALPLFPCYLRSQITLSTEQFATLSSFNASSKPDSSKRSFFLGEQKVLEDVLVSECMEVNLFYAVFSELTFSIYKYFLCNKIENILKRNFLFILWIILVIFDTLLWYMRLNCWETNVLIFQMAELSL